MPKAARKDGCGKTIFKDILHIQNCLGRFPTSVNISKFMSQWGEQNSDFMKCLPK